MFLKPILIGDIWATQKNLKRIDQIYKMIEALRNEELLPLIDINYVDDGEYEIKNGHHRIMAYYIYGYEKLDDYNLYYTEYPKPRFWQIKNSPFMREFHDIPAKDFKI